MIHFTNPSTTEWIWNGVFLVVGLFGGWKAGRRFPRKAKKTVTGV